MSLSEFIYFNKKKIILGFLSIVIVGGCFIYYYFYQKEEVNLDNNINLKMDEVKKEEKKEEVVSEKCYFDIKGEVKNPGVYSIECDKRIIDAINESGGLTKNSDTSVLNLSKKIEDGMVIVIYSKKEVSDYLNTLKELDDKSSICDNSNIENDACSDNNSSNNNSLININTASISELMSLSGIGEAKAKSIISYREKTPFKTIEDIKNVEGIGESLYASIKENITV